MNELWQIRPSAEFRSWLFCLARWAAIGLAAAGAVLLAALWLAVMVVGFINVASFILVGTLFGLLLFAPLIVLNLAMSAVAKAVASSFPSTQTFISNPDAWGRARFGHWWPVVVLVIYFTCLALVARAIF